MTIRERTLAVVLVLVAILGGVAYFLMPRSAGEAADSPRVVQATISPSAAPEFARIRSAETITDSEQRCLAYPDPAEFSWDPEVVKAFCHLSTRRMISRNEIKDALDKNHTEWLQQTFDSYLARTFKHGEHGFLTWAYWYMFQNASKEGLELTTRWIEADPNSAYALAARGIHYVEAAYQARGIAFVKDTPPENFERMDVLVVKAKADLLESLRREPRLIAAYHGLLGIARLKGDIELRLSSVNNALALDPADQWVYDDWIDTVEPKWGGSYEEMQQAADAAAEHASENPLLKRARSRPICYAAQQRACQKCGHTPDNVEALELYRQAVATAPGVCFLNGAGWIASQLGDAQTAARYYSQSIRFLHDNDSVSWRANELLKLGHADWAVEDMDKLLAADPKNTKALDGKAYIVELDNRPSEAAALYRQMLESDPKNERAALQLSRLYLSKLPDQEKAKTLLTELLQRNPKLARAWLYKATLAKDDHAACREALAKYLEYVDRSDAHEKSEIARAQARLTELESGSG